MIAFVPAVASPTNSIQKSCAVLRTLAAHPALRLSELAVASGLNKVTALRIIETLIEEGFVRRLANGRHYELGAEALALAAARRPNNLRELARPSLVRLAELSEDTVLLSVRSGAEAVCIERQLGAFPIRANYLDIGSRRPLGVGAGSMALLAWLPDREIETLLEIVAPRLPAFSRLEPADIRAEISHAREHGYVIVLDKVIERMGAVGMPLRGPAGEVVGAISIAALSERIRERQIQLVGALRRETVIIERELQ
jgi:DNA-binding IclR family transcriptional regulator